MQDFNELWPTDGTDGTVRKISLQIEAEKILKRFLL